MCLTNESESKITAQISVIVLPEFTVTDDHERAVGLLHAPLIVTVFFRLVCFLNTDKSKQ